MLKTLITVDRSGIVSAREVEVPDPEPTVEDRLAAVEQVVIAPARDAKTLAQKVEELQALLVAKGVVDKADVISIVADTAIDSGGVKPKVP